MNVCVYWFKSLLFFPVLCDNFNFVPSYSMVETSYNTVFGINGLLVIQPRGSNHKRAVDEFKDGMLGGNMDRCRNMQRRNYRNS
jgi:hypothetical protein